jgi:hypothetical protein
MGLQSLELLLGQCGKKAILEWAVVNLRHSRTPPLSELPERYFIDLFGRNHAQGNFECLCGVTHCVRHRSQCLIAMGSLSTEDVGGQCFGVGA